MQCAKPRDLCFWVLSALMLSTPAAWTGGSGTQAHRGGDEG